MADLIGNKPFYLGYTGGIDSAGVSRICSSLNAALNEGADSIHLAFNSNGGHVSDGIYLYNHIRALPYRIVIYNTGSVASIATTAFLAADERYCSAHSTFLIHPAAFPQLSEANAEKLRVFYGSALADDERIDAILRERARLPDELLSARRFNDVWLNPQESLKYGVVHDIREFAIPDGFQAFQI